MKLEHLAALASGVLITGLLPCQSWESAFPSTNPTGGDRGDAPSSVPTRIENEPYGESLASSLLGLAVDPWGESFSSIRTGGGEPGAGAVLLVSDLYAQVPVSFGTLLVGPNIVPIPGVFDAAGEFHMPIDLGNTAFIDTSLYFQALEVKATETNASAGLRVSYHPGNPQQVSSYAGPPMEAILLRNIGHLIPTLHGVLLRCHIPAGSTLDSMVVRDPVVGSHSTSVYVDLLSDDSREASSAAITLRRYVDLGPLITPEIEIWVASSSPDAACACYELVAVVETSLPER